MQQPKIDLKTTTPLVSSSGNQVFVPGIIFRKVSKFILGSDKDGIVPIDVFFDVKTGEILLDMIPKELKEEYQKYNEEVLKEKK